MGSSLRVGLPEIPLPVGTLLIADLHLNVEDEASDTPDIDGFLAWLACHPAPVLVILGDLFEVWVGAGQAGLPGSRRVLEALAEHPSRPVHLIPGNRDFLFDGGTGGAFGISVHRDGALGLLPDGGRVLLVHGDEFCTLDRPYQRMKRILRGLRRPLGWLPLPWGQALGRRLRGTSQRAVAAKAPAHKAMQSDACLAAARTARAQHVVCGHAHVASERPLETGGSWWVLEAFGEGGSGGPGGTGVDGLEVLRVGPEGIAPSA